MIDGNIKIYKNYSEIGRRIRNFLFGIQGGFLVLKFTFLGGMSWKMVFLPLFIYVCLIVLGFFLIGFICSLGMKKLIKNSEER